MLNKLRHFTTILVLLLSSTAAGPLWAAEAPDAPVVDPLDPATYDVSKLVLGEDQGVIDELNFAGMSAVISGYLYPVSPNVTVEIGGTYGAFTMLSKGMRVRFSYLEFDDGVNLITEIIEDPAAEEF